MEAAEPRRSPFARSVWDTGSLIFMGFSAAFIPLFLVAISMIWISRFWTLGEKLFATLLPLSLIALSAGLGLVGDAGRIPLMAVMPAFIVVAFALAFRMGLRSDRRPG